jgi:mono/diheme cytochrome c family protein
MGLMALVMWPTSSAKAQDASAAPLAEEHVMAKSPVEAGRYLVKIGGCNDCHTDGWMAPGGENIPEDKWLLGSPVGFRGPWGTTYATNLRYFARTFSEDGWVRVLRARNTRPPMAWPSLHAMSDADLKAIFHYLKSFEVVGDPVPLALPPGVEPTTPYFVFEPVMPAGQGAATQPATP